MDFAEKVRWHIEHDSIELVAAFQDKFRVKDFVRQHGVRVANILQVTEVPNSIAFGNLPADCIIKPNHGSGWAILRKNSRYFRSGTNQFVLDEFGELLPETNLIFHELKEEQVVGQCEQWLQSRYSKLERSYHVIPPVIIVEEMLCSASGGEMKDYRFYTYRGKVRAISIGSPTYRKRQLNAFLSPEWNLIPLTKYKEELPTPLPDPPSRLPEMLDIASTLGARFDFVRVDLYDTSQGVVFGEFTFYPQAGDPDTPTTCKRFNRWLAYGWPLRALTLDIFSQSGTSSPFEEKDFSQIGFNHSHD